VGRKTIAVFVAGEAIFEVRLANVVAVKTRVAVEVVSAAVGTGRKSLLLQTVAVNRGIGPALVGEGLFVAPGVVGLDRSGLAHVVDALSILPVPLTHFRIVAHRLEPMVIRAQGRVKTAVSRLATDVVSTVAGVALRVGVANRTFGEGWHTLTILVTKRATCAAAVVFAIGKAGAERADLVTSEQPARSGAGFDALPINTRLAANHVELHPLLKAERRGTIGGCLIHEAIAVIVHPVANFEGGDVKRLTSPDAGGQAGAKPGARPELVARFARQFLAFLTGQAKAVAGRRCAQTLDCPFLVAVKAVGAGTLIVALVQEHVSPVQLSAQDIVERGRQGRVARLAETHQRGHAQVLIVEGPALPIRGTDLIADGGAHPTEGGSEALPRIAIFVGFAQFTKGELDCHFRLGLAFRIGFGFRNVSGISGTGFGVGQVRSDQIDLAGHIVQLRPDIDRLRGNRAVRFQVRRQLGFDIGQGQLPARIEQVDSAADRRCRTMGERGEAENKANQSQAHGRSFRAQTKPESIILSEDAESKLVPPRANGRSYWLACPTGA